MTFGSFAGALTRLIPPPLIDLLLAHVEVFGVSGSEFLDALPGPHGVLPELRAKEEELTLGFAFALPVLVDFVQLQALGSVVVYVHLGVVAPEVLALRKGELTYDEFVRRGRAAVFAEAGVQLRERQILGGSRCGRHALG